MLHSMNNPRIARSVLLTWCSGNTLKTGNYVQFTSPLRRFKKELPRRRKKGSGLFGVSTVSNWPLYRQRRPSFTYDSVSLKVTRLAQGLREQREARKPIDNWRVYTYTVVRRVGSSDVRCNGNILGSEASPHQGHDLGSRVRQSSLQYRDNTSSDKSKETEGKVGALVSMGISEQSSDIH